ncbi:MAG: cation-transporting P-type ATPase [Isosphaeraceae bacterium]
MSVRTASDQSPTTFWSVTLEDLLLHLQATPEGLSAEGARQRLSSGTPSLHKPVWGSRVLTLLLAQFQSPIILILLFAVALSFFLREATVGLIAELMDEDPKTPRCVAEPSGRFGRWDTVDEEGPQSLVLSVGGVGWLQEPASQR